MATAKQRISTPRRVGLVMTYNQRETCIEAINSLLVQTLALDLIIVSDDCSTDGTYGVITDHFSKNGKPSNVELYQSEKNLGFIPHFNALLKNHCRDDDLIFYNAGDDISETSRVEEFYGEYIAKGKPRHFLGHSYVTSFGSGTEEILVPPIESIKENRELCLIASAYHIGASQVFTGALFFDFGPILYDDCYEDLTLGYRALLKNAYHFVPKALLRYRVGGLSSWQKNPLEKKRSRLKSTLTQRAVDSMRSGDFEAQTIIQDCYRQYGFTLSKSQDLLEVIIINSNSASACPSTYTISDYFNILDNVCRPQHRTVSSFKLHKTQNHSFGQTALLWIVVPGLSSADLLAIYEVTKENPEQKLVLDIGLHSPPESMIHRKRYNKIFELFLNTFPFASIHISNSATLVSPLSPNHANRTTYLKPLQSIDGPDPAANVCRSRRGLIVACDDSELVHRTLSLAYESIRINAGDMIELDTYAHAAHSLFSEKNLQTPIFRNGHELIDNVFMEQYSFLILLSGRRVLEPDVITHWWSVASSRCLPTFMNKESEGIVNLSHGESCLFVDNAKSAWNVAADLIRSSYPALLNIAKEARRRAYFGCSVQKNISQISSILELAVGRKCRFDKFLPL